jgi:hypothetical protein
MADDSPFRQGGPLRNGHKETPEQRARRERAEALKARARDAMHDAEQVFWAKMAELFPEVTHGDFPPDATFAWHDAMERALYTWLRWNYPDGEEILDDIAKLE